MRSTFRYPLFLLALLLWFGSGSAWGQSWARVSVPLADVFREPDPESERVTQSLLWEPVLIQKVHDGWAKVMILDQYREPVGYPGWTLRSNLVSGTPKGVRYNYQVVVPWASLYEKEGGTQVEAVFWGTKLVAWPGESSLKDQVAVKLPGVNEPRYIDREGVLGLGAHSSWREIEEGLEHLYRLEGVPYLWGGMSSLGIDCSGLTYQFASQLGWVIPRDADQQSEVGEMVSLGEQKRGDLLFFGRTRGDITHVGVSLGGNDFFHASSHSGRVVFGDLEDPMYGPRLQTIRRLPKNQSFWSKKLVPGGSR